MEHSLVDALNQRIRGTMAELLGMRITHAEPRRVAGTFTVRPDLYQPYGVLHGGALMTFLDTLAGMAASINVPTGRIFTTVEFKINLMRSIRAGVFSGEATPAHLGQRTQVWQMTAYDPEGRPLAIAALTQLVIEPRDGGS
jgi:uncharacterized protein (TIGR00369 family)